MSKRTRQQFDILQEVHEPHCSPKKQLQSISTFAQSYDYSITWRELKVSLFSLLKFSRFFYLNPLETGGGLHSNKLESSLPEGVWCQIWLKLTQLFWSRIFLNLVNVFFWFCYYFFLGTCRPFNWTSPNLRHPGELNTT